MRSAAVINHTPAATTWYRVCAGSTTWQTNLPRRSAPGVIKSGKSATTPWPHRPPHTSGTDVVRKWKRHWRTQRCR